MNASAVASAAPFLNRVRMIAAEAYEHDELAAPATEASAISFAPSLPNALRISSAVTVACNSAEM